MTGRGASCICAQRAGSWSWMPTCVTRLVLSGAAGLPGGSRITAMAAAAAPSPSLRQSCRRANQGNKKLHERGPPLSLAEWTGLAPISEQPARGFTITQSTAPGGDVGRIWHIPDRSSTARSAAWSRPGWWHRRPCSPAAGPADHLHHHHHHRAQGSCGLIGHPVQHVRDVQSHPLIKFTLLDRAGTDPAGPLQPQKAILQPIASAISAERPQHRDRLAAGHGHSGAELPRRTTHCGADRT